MEAPSLNPFEKSAIEMRKMKCDSLFKEYLPLSCRFWQSQWSLMALQGL